MEYYRHSIATSIKGSNSATALPFRIAIHTVMLLSSSYLTLFFFFLLQIQNSARLGQWSYPCLCLRPSSVFITLPRGRINLNADLATISFSKEYFRANDYADFVFLKAGEGLCSWSTLSKRRSNNGRYQPTTRSERPATIAKKGMILLLPRKDLGWGRLDGVDLESSNGQGKHFS